MPKFEISIEGHNLLISKPGNESDYRLLNLFATVYVEASSPEDADTIYRVARAAEARAAEVLRADPNITAVSKNPPDRPIELTVDDASELEQGVVLPGPIVSFFEAPMSDEQTALSG